ncbi:MAG: hypothetical protein AAF493_06925 [Pseudomonadota bacterium]
MTLVRPLAGTTALLLLFAIIVGALHAGPDFERYFDWTRVFLTGDFFELQSQTQAPTGLPLSQWSPGPGLYFSLPLHLIQPPLGDIADARWPAGVGTARWWVLGWGAITALCFWLTLGQALRRVAGGDGWLIALGVVIALTATQVGFYSVEIASETLALFAGALLLKSLSDFYCNQRFSTAAAISFAAALLVLIRPQLIVYAAPALLWAGLFGVAKSSRSQEAYPNPSPILSKDACALAAMLSLPLLAAIGVSVYTNYLMTGNVIQSPLSFGDDDYQSLNWMSPNWFGVLFHPWKGALVQHPVYGLGFLALVIASVRAPDRWLRFASLLGAIAIFAHVYVHSAWYGWWLGTRSFGIRGLCVAALVLLPALIWWIRDSLSKNSTTASNFVIIGTIALIILGGIWSTMLSWHGAHVAMQLTDVVNAFYQALSAPAALPRLPLTALIAIVVGFWFVRRHVALANSTAYRPHPAVVTAVIGLAVIGLDYWLIRARGLHLPYGLHMTDGSHAHVLHEVVASVLVLATLMAIALFVTYRTAPAPDADRNRLAPALAVVFVASIAVFTRTTLPSPLANSPPPSQARQWQWHGHFDLPTVRDTYYEYLSIPGFVPEKVALRDFLRRTINAEPTQSPPGARVSRVSDRETNPASSNHLTRIQ